MFTFLEFAFLYSSINGCYFVRWHHFYDLSICNKQSRGSDHYNKYWGRGSPTVNGAIRRRSADHGYDSP